MKSFIQSPVLSPLPRVIHGFTPRSLGSDYRLISEKIPGKPRNFFTLKQIHSRNVFLLGSDATEEDRKHQGDAIITQESDVLIAVRTADCVPLLVYDPESRAIAAIHAGWRGLVGGVIENTAREMEKHFRSKPSSWSVAVGAALCEACFEVGPEVVEEFKKRFGPDIPVKQGREDRCHLDLRSFCIDELTRLGVVRSLIDQLPYCTSCHRDSFYSYRRGDEEGRNLSFIGLSG